MKKPKITPAPWEIERDDFTIWINGKGEKYKRTICAEPFSEAHAKAIVQVPNMIDELINNLEVLEICASLMTQKDMSTKFIDMQIEKNKQVLLKSGCKL